MLRRSREANQSTAPSVLKHVERTADIPEAFLLLVVTAVAGHSRREDDLARLEIDHLLGIEDDHFLSLLVFVPRRVVRIRDRDRSGERLAL